MRLESSLFSRITEDRATSLFKPHPKLAEGLKLPENHKLSTSPGTNVLELVTGKLLGSGKTGFVHAVTARDGSDLPDLCVKIAFPSERRALSQEAWFYDDLQALQGSVIPGCYGYFEHTLPSDTKLCRSDHEDRFKEPIDGKSIPGRIGILLLERLSGEHLPLRVPLDEDKHRCASLPIHIIQMVVKFVPIARMSTISSKRSPITSYNITTFVTTTYYVSSHPALRCQIESCLAEYSRRRGASWTLLIA